MRLSDFERVNIKKSVKEFFGKESRVLVFGSRALDNQKGGDIDLYIIPENQNDKFEKKINDSALKVQSIQHPTISPIPVETCCARLIYKKTP